MNLTDNDRPWAPEDQPDYLCVLRAHQLPPVKREDFLLCQANLLRRLVAEASEGEIEDANRRLRFNLPTEFLDFLPGKLVNDPRCPDQMMFNPAVLGSPLHEWKVGWNDLANGPVMPLEEAREMAEELSLESFLSRLL